MIRTVIRYTDNKILLNDAEVFETYKILQKGLYDIELDRYNEFQNFIVLNNPKIFPLMPSDELKNIDNYINTFLSKDYENLCNKAQILKKSGILLYGKQGIGKSNYINNIINLCINEGNACIFNINSYNKLRVLIPKLKEFKDIQNNLFVIVLEEVDQLLSIESVEAMLKNLMDGIDSVDNLLFLASTNYIEKIPKSLIERPSRFKKVLEIKSSENIEENKKWLKETYNNFIEDLTEEDCENLHEMCLNKSIDEIKHILIDYKMNITTLQKKKKLGYGK